jgi:hypothetical protein
VGVAPPAGAGTLRHGNNPIYFLTLLYHFCLVQSKENTQNTTVQGYEIDVKDTQRAHHRQLSQYDSQ